MKSVLTCALLAVLAGGCNPNVGIKVTVVDQKTQLENQITGTYSALEEQAWMVASVRGEEGNKELEKHSISERQIFKAINSRKYYADDIADFMEKGCLGENARGLVEARTDGCAAGTSEDDKLIQKLIRKENEARMTIMKGVIANDLKLKVEDMPFIEEAFAKKHRGEAGNGWWIQAPGGKWTKK